MKQEKQRISSLRQSPWFPLVGYGAILLAFCLFCPVSYTHLTLPTN